jgi:hypothetical protein
VLLINVKGVLKVRPDMNIDKHMTVIMRFLFHLAVSFFSFGYLIHKINDIIIKIKFRIKEKMGRKFACLIEPKQPQSLILYLK